MVKERAAYKTRLGEYVEQFPEDGFEVYSIPQGDDKLS
jgi:hypothetical protein